MINLLDYLCYCNTSLPEYIQQIVNSNPPVTIVAWCDWWRDYAKN